MCRSVARSVGRNRSSGPTGASPGRKKGRRVHLGLHRLFPAMQIGLVKGRAFTSADAPGTSPSAIINETLAQEFWPNQDPIGRELRFGEQHTVCTIVGMVKDIKMYQLRPRPERQIYVSLAQFPSVTHGFVVRTAGNATGMPTAIRNTILVGGPRSTDFFR